jgi:hypothetical protein
MTRSGPVRVVVTLLKVMGGIVAGVVLLGVAVAGWVHYSQASNSRRAEAFCETVQRGEPIAAVAARSVAAGMSPLPRDDQLPFHAFVYPSQWGLHGCEVETVDGRVVAKRVLTISVGLPRW